jgi:hypothetical protein
MYAPTKTWRRWHRKINVGQKRYAVVSAIAASALPALVMARGHRIDAVPEIPLVISDAAGEHAEPVACPAELRTRNACFGALNVPVHCCGCLAVLCRCCCCCCCCASLLGGGNGVIWSQQTRQQIRKFAASRQLAAGRMAMEVQQAGLAA